jgi:hypothetical protein
VLSSETDYAPLYELSQSGDYWYVGHDAAACISQACISNNHDICYENTPSGGAADANADGNADAAVASGMDGVFVRGSLLEGW